MYKRGRSLTSLLLALPPVMLVSAPGCRSPTEVSLDLTTDVPCASFTGASIAVGTQDTVETKPPATTTSTCNAAGSIGSLVIVPSGSDDAEITIRVAGGVNRDPETCTDDAADFSGCIVSRRAVRFIEHTPLTLEVPLRSACLGVVCPATQTCVEGACVSDQVPATCGTGGEACGEAQLDLDGAVPADGGVVDAGTDADATVAPPEGGTMVPADATADAPPPDAADAADAADASPPAPTCADGTEVGALWPVTGRCSNHDSHTTLLGESQGHVACNASSGTVESPLAIDAAGQLYTGDTKGVLRIYDAMLNPVRSVGVDKGAISSLALISSTELFVGSATALGKVLLPIGADATVTSVQKTQAPLPLVVARNGEVITDDGAVIDAYGAAFPSTAWTYLAPTTGMFTPYPVSVATVPSGSLVTSWGNASLLYPLSNDGAATTAIPSAEPVGYLLLDATHGGYTWNQPGLALWKNGPESDITSIVGVALTSNALAVTSNPTEQMGMFSLYDPVTVKATVQVSLAQGTTVVSAPAVDGNDTVYFLTSDGKLHVRTAAGIDTPLPATGVSTTSAPPPIIGNGVVYVGGLSGGGICMYR
jgi:hypothetical protein